MSAHFEFLASGYISALAHRSAPQWSTVVLTLATMAPSGDGLHLANGKLKPIFGMEQAVRVKAHFVVYPAKHAKRPPVEAFLAWIHGEAARTQPGRA